MNGRLENITRPGSKAQVSLTKYSSDFIIIQFVNLFINNLLMKILFLVLIGLLSLCFCFTVQSDQKQQTPNYQISTNRDIIQLTLDGIFFQNKLPKSTSIIQCIDEATAGDMVKLLGQFLVAMARGSASDHIQIHETLVHFYNEELPEQVKDCLETNSEVDALTAKYGIYEGDITDFNKKFVQYYTLHYLAVHKWFGDLNNQWTKSLFYETGFNGADIFHKIVA